MVAMRGGRLIGTGLVLGAVAMLLWAGPATAFGGGIEGKVTDEAGAPIAGVTVCAQATAMFGHGECDRGTDAAGDYSIGGLAEGSYLVGFQVEGNPLLNYAQQWYDGVAHPEEGATVPVQEGETTEGIDASMRTGGEIAGTVTDAVSGAPIEGVEVCEQQVGYLQTGEVDYCAKTDAAGDYTVKNLDSGEYRVEFRTDEGPNYIAARYPTGVAVTAGQVSGGIDIGLRSGLQIEGDVTDAATGLPPDHLTSPDAPFGIQYSSVLVCALEPGSERRVLCTSLEPDGHYVLAGLPVGSYVVSFGLDSIEEGFDLHPDGYVRRYWDEAASFGEATPVGSSTSTAIGGIDAALTRGEEVLPPGVRVWSLGYGAPASPSALTNGPAIPAPTAHAHRRVPSQVKRICRKGRRRVANGGHLRCVRIKKKKTAYRPKRTKEIRR
jgi:hypothetical protein